MTTTRTRTISRTFPSYQNYSFRNPGGLIVGPYVQETGSRDTCCDNNNRGFKKTQALGVVTLSEFSLIKWSRSITPTSLVCTNLNNNLYTMGGDRIGELGGQPPVPAFKVNMANWQRLLTKAYANINSTPIMGGELLSDLDKTVSMLRRPFKSSLSLLSKMTKYKTLRLGKTAASAAKASANAWLEYRYGWQPIILDANQIIKDVHKIGGKVDRKRLVARAGDSAQRNWGTVWSASSNPWGYSGSYNEERKLRCNVGVIYEVVPRSSLSGLQSYFGFRTRDIPATVWEIVPYSFVCDWFFNVGDWLQAVTPNPDVNILGNWVTMVEDVTYTKRGDRNDLVDKWIGSMGSETVHTVSVNRIVNQELPTYPEPKGFSLSVLHSVDAAALAVKPILANLNKLRH